MLRDLGGEVYGIDKTKIGSDFYEKYARLDVMKVAAKIVSDSSHELLHPNAKVKAQEAEKYSSNSPEEPRISIALKFH